MTDDRAPHGCWLLPLFLVSLLFWGALAWFLWPKDEIAAACVEYVTDDPVNEPSGVMGCELYGVGVASTWAGPGVARNDCTYPWTDCQPIRITSLDTGLSVEVRPRMYCDCYMKPGPNGEGPRIADLPPDVVAALGLPGPGLWDVRVEAIETPALGISLPDTAMAP